MGTSRFIFIRALSLIFTLSLIHGLHGQTTYIKKKNGMILVVKQKRGEGTNTSSKSATTATLSPDDVGPTYLGTYNTTVDYNEPDQVWTVVYIAGGGGCNSDAVGAITIITPPQYGTVTTYQSTFTEGPGSICPGSTFPAVVAAYTWNAPTFEGITDSFEIQATGPIGNPLDIGYTVELAGKGEGDCCKQPGGVDVGDPISIGTGNVFEKVTDYATSGQNTLSFSRYYNSVGVPNTFANSLGAAWRSNFDRYLNFISSNMIVAERPDGQLINFYNSSGSWISDSDADYTLAQVGGVWQLTDHDDTVETYTVSSSGQGLLNNIRLRDGYSQSLTYNSNNQFVAVTDSYNRQLIFTYSGGVINTLTTPDGLILTYGYNSAYETNDQLTSVSYPTLPASELQYLYNDANNPWLVTGITDENGNIYQTWTYDSYGRGTSNQVGGSADLVSVAYNDSNGSRAVTNAFGVTDTYSFSILQNTPKVTQISRAATNTTAAATETFSFDSNGYLSGQTDWNGNQTTYVNDSHGDPTTINEAVGSSVARTTTIAYDSTWVHLPDTITTPGLMTAFTYDDSGDVLTRTLTDTTNNSTRVWQYTWQNSLLASVQSPRTDVVEKTTYAYDSTGALTGVTNPLNQLTSITSHTGGGLPLTMVDPNGVTTTLAYDPRQRLLSSTTAGHVTSYGYDAAENLTSVTQPDGSSLKYTYDAAHRLTAITDLFGDKISYTLDALGDRTATGIVNASNSVTSEHSKTFDALGRMLQDIGASNQTSSFSYDAMGNMVTATDQASNTTHRSFDALNRLYQITDPAGGVTTTSYDAHDRPVGVASPNGVATAHVYDGFGDLIQESNPNTGTTTYSYDSTGNRIARVAATGNVTRYTYDALDRLLTMTFPFDSAENVTYTYDQGGHGSGIGRLTSVSDAAGTLSRSYDQWGNLLGDARTTSAATLTTAYTYDTANRIASIAYPSGVGVSYSRDIMGRVTAVAEQPSGGTSTPVVSSVAYEPFGPYTTLGYGNGVAEARSFDQDYRMTGIADAGTATLQNLAYAYYPTNNVQTITDAVNSGNNQSFSYDSLHRLTQAMGSYGSYGYTYDGDGNQLSETLGFETVNFGYGTGSDQLATVSVAGFGVIETIGYTADGRMAAVNFQSPGGQGIASFSYNQRAQLSSANAGAGILASYTYDGFGQRLIKTISGSYGEIYQYGRDGALLEETNASGVALADYIYLNGRPVAVLNGATLYYLHDDHLGTPQLATDAGQNIQWQESYDPFFAEPSASGTITQNLRLPGQYYDVETGFYHNGFRNYLPGYSRYLEPDPLGRLGSGNNLYAYADDDPINSADPTGLSGTIRIYSWGTYGTGFLWQGYHSWITYTPDGGSTTWYSTYGNNPLGLPNGLETNLPYDQNDPYDGVRSAHLNDAQEAALMQFINSVRNQGTNGWSVGRPCSQFASDAWRAGTGEWLPTGSPAAPSSPAGLTQSINTANAANPSFLQLTQWLWSHFLFF